MIPDLEKKELIRLLEVDYKNTNEFIKGVVATSATIRGWSITLVLALLGLAFDRHLWQVAALTAAFVMMLALIDAYHSWLYSQGLNHARFIERILSLYYVSMSRGRDDPEAVEEFETELEVYRFGLTSNLVRFRWSSLGQARPRLVLGILYSVLLLASLATIALIVFTNGSTRALSCTSVGETRLGIYRCVEQGGK